MNLFVSIAAFIVAPLNEDCPVPIVAAVRRDCEVRGGRNGRNATPTAIVVALSAIGAHVHDAPAVAVAIPVPSLLVRDLEHADRADEVKGRIGNVDIRPILDKLKRQRRFWDRDDRICKQFRRSI